jgi:hypothetical protein
MTEPKKYVLRKDGTKYRLWSDLAAWKLNKLPGVSNGYTESAGMAPHLVFVINPRYDEKDVLARVQEAATNAIQ